MTMLSFIEFDAKNFQLCDQIINVYDLFLLATSSQISHVQLKQELTGSESITPLTDRHNRRQ